MSVTERGLGLGAFAVAFVGFVFLLAFIVVGLWLFSRWRRGLDDERRE